MDDYLIKLSEALGVCLAYCPDDDGTCSKAGEDLRNMLDELESLQTYKQEQDWIKCSDRMPEVGETVIVAWKHTVFKDCKYNHEISNEYMQMAIWDYCNDPDEEAYDDYTWLNAWDKKPVYANNITHWKPIPNFPIWDE